MQFVSTLLNGYSGGLDAEAEHVGDLQTLTVPTKAQFHCYVFHFYLTPTCFRLTAIIGELTPILLKYNLQSTFYNILNIYFNYNLYILICISTVKLFYCWKF
jgi:hypothetical protein